MKFRLVIEGKLFGIRPVRLTPVDETVPKGKESAAFLAAKLIGRHPIRIGVFNGYVFAQLK